MKTQEYDFHASRKPRNRSAVLNVCLKYVPYLTKIFTLTLFVWISWILITNNINIFIFLLSSFQLLINWYAITKKSGKFDSKTYLSNPSSQTSVITNGHVQVQKVWYCNRCNMDTLYESHHCPLCETCIIQRDHHCFFLGVCINRQNMKHFIIFCFDASLCCCYTALTLFSTTKLDTLFQYFLPVSLGYFVTGKLSTYILIKVAVINMTFSSGILALCFGFYQLWTACIGKLPYSTNLEKNNSIIRNLLQLFDGPKGFLNVLFPIDLFKIDKNVRTIDKLV